MKNILQSLLALLLVAGLCACGMIKGGGQEDGTVEFVSFSFTHTGMSTDECYLYSVQQTEEGVRLYTEELFSGGQIVDTVIDEPVLEQLSGIAEKYRMIRWDGFDKKNRRVSDGSRFVLSAELSDGRTISASGSNKFPEGYADAEQEIRTLFEDLIGKYGADS